MQDLADPNAPRPVPTPKKRRSAFALPVCAAPEFHLFPLFPTSKGMEKPKKLLEKGKNSGAAGSTRLLFHDVFRRLLGRQLDVGGFFSHQKDRGNQATGGITQGTAEDEGQDRSPEHVAGGGLPV